MISVYFLITTDFTFRIFLTDFYLSKPIPYVDNIYNDFNSREIFQVPIIRIFGTTPKGQKVCAHIHGVYPYFYVAFVGDIETVNDTVLRDKYLLDFAKSLDQAITTSFEYKQTSTSFVYKIVLVKGKQFYGYQDKYQYFLKVFLFNPMLIKRSADLLLAGAVMGTAMQPYEAHISYNLKFFIDYNLYGMNFLYTDGAKFRLNSDYEKRYDYCDLSSTQTFKNLSQKLWNIEEMNCDNRNNAHFMSQQTCPKQSCCELEVDIAACDILNILEIQEHLGQNPGLKSLWEEERQRRIDLGMTESSSELVGQVYEERPLAQKTQSERDLLSRWQQDIVDQNKEGDEEGDGEETIRDKEIIDFLGASQDEQDREGDEEVKEKAEEDSFRRLSFSSSMSSESERVLASLVDLSQSINVNQSTVPIVSDTATTTAGVKNTVAQQRFNETDLIDDDDDDWNDDTVLQQFIDNDDATGMELAETNFVKPPSLSSMDNDHGSKSLRVAGREVEGRREYSYECSSNRSVKISIKERSETEIEVIVIDSDGEDDRAQRVSQSDDDLSSAEEDVFGKTFIDLSLDDDDDDNDGSYVGQEHERGTGEKEETIEREKGGSREGVEKKLQIDISKKKNRLLITNVNSSSEDLFLDDDDEKEEVEQESQEEKEQRRDLRFGDGEEVVILSSDSEDLIVLETYDGADNDDSNGENDCNEITEAFGRKRKKTMKTIPVSSTLIRSPILTRSRNRPVVDKRRELSLCSSSTAMVVMDAKNYFLPIITKRRKQEKEKLRRKRKISMSLKSGATVSSSEPVPLKPSENIEDDLSVTILALDEEQNKEKGKEKVKGKKREKKESGNETEEKERDKKEGEQNDRVKAKKNQHFLSIDSFKSPTSSQMMVQSREKKSHVNDHDRIEWQLPCHNWTPSPPLPHDSAPVIFSPLCISSAYSTTSIATADPGAVFVTSPLSYNRNQPFSTPTRSQCCPTLSETLFENISPIVHKTLSKLRTPLSSSALGLPPRSPFPFPLVSSSSPTSSSIPFRQNNRPNVLSFDSTTVVRKGFVSNNVERNAGTQENEDQTEDEEERGKDQEEEGEEMMKSQKLTHLKLMKQSIRCHSVLDFSANTTLNRPKYTDVCHLTILSVEIFCGSQSNLKSNPSLDPVLMVFYTVYDEFDDETEENVEDKIDRVKGIEKINDNGDDDDDGLTNEVRGRIFRGIIYVNIDRDLLIDVLPFVVDGNIHSVAVSNEAELFDKVIELVWEFDPDILVGFETKRSSWGYLHDRSLHLKHRLWNCLGRILPLSDDGKLSFNSDKIGSKDRNLSEHTFKETQLLRCTGRIIIDLWLVMKYEVTLNLYTLENCARHVLKEVVPLYTNQQLLTWYRSNHERGLTVRHFTYRSLANVRLLKKIDFIGRTSEFARIFGIEFEHVYMRGSQYRVESMMLRLAKPQNLIGLSPSPKQRCQQKAPECIPLTLEPRSGLYRDPVVVLDFQSLYPSIMIAYNYCYSTTLGKIDHINSVQHRSDPYELGCWKTSLSQATIQKIGSRNVTISPNGVVFVRPEIEKGIISKMVEEILDTRIMIKKSMKLHSKNKVLWKRLDSRQLGLKLIANVTFGYTAASYSGRMPCVEVGDSIVRKARETLHEAIRLVNGGGPRGQRKSDADGGWDGCFVVYGDTDSLFVSMPNRSVTDAFRLGARIVEAVNEMNPFPVRLQLEKVFMPCLLEAKKKYVGMSFESPDQREPVFLAKGIETVRRDNCRIVSTILEGVLNRLFSSMTMENIKKYIIRKIDNIRNEKYNLIDFIIAKEFRGRNGYKEGASIPALQIANQLSKIDPRAEPLKGERVPYVVIQGAPGDTLISCIRRPEDIVFNTRYLKSLGTNLRHWNETGCRLSTTYYIAKQILPPVDRALSLVGVNVFQWYAQMPQKRYTSAFVPRQSGRGRLQTNLLNRTISSYFQSQNCLLCQSMIKKRWDVPEDSLVSVLCQQCIDKGKRYVYLTAMAQMKDVELCRKRVVQTCNMCTATDKWTYRGIGPPCVSIDCPVFFNRVRAFQQSTDHWEELLNSTSFNL